MAVKTALLLLSLLLTSAITAPTGTNADLELPASQTSQARQTFTDPCSRLICDGDEEPFYSILSKSCYCSTMEMWHKKENEVLDKLPLQGRQAAPDPVPTFIPPPKQDLTPALIQESLSVQPQNSAVISSVVPFHLDGNIHVYLQLDGPISNTLMVNASTSLPCGTIGLADPQPDIGVVPLVMNNGQGQPQTMIADCECIAVNMYQPYVITYWIQKLSDGTIYSVLGDALVTDIDKMNTTQSTALALVALPPGVTKRAVGTNIDYVKPEKRQVRAPSEGLVARSLIQPDLMNAKMTAEACAAITCFYNNGKPTPALFNPFHQTCWCVSQPYIESNPNAWKPSS